ncbi:helix-turn-helix domain-containing protein [Planktomarina temperata]|nr:helix-turn-helix domain-containing protein [Planktomarina temperata]
MRLSNKIVQDRAETLGITQRELALKLKITARTVNRWFSGGSQIPSKYDKKIREILYLTDDVDLSLTAQENITTRTLKTPNFMKKRMSVTVTPQTTNAYEFIERRFGISRHRLVEIAPLLLNCLSTLAIEHDAKQLKEYDDLDLPDGWGPAEPQAKVLVEQQQQTVKEQNAFRSKSLTRFINHLISTRMNCGTKASDEVEHAMWGAMLGREVEFDLTSLWTGFDLNERQSVGRGQLTVNEDGKKVVREITPFPVDFEEFFTFAREGQTDRRFVAAINQGLIDLSQIKSDLWAENKRDKLHDAIVDLANKTKNIVSIQNIDIDEKNYLITEIDNTLSGLNSFPAAQVNVSYNTADAKFDIQKLTQRIPTTDERKAKDDG